MLGNILEAMRMRRIDCWILYRYHVCLRMDHSSHRKVQGTTNTIFPVSLISNRILSTSSTVNLRQSLAHQSLCSPLVIGSEKKVLFVKMFRHQAPARPSNAEISIPSRRTTAPFPDSESSFFLRSATDASEDCGVLQLI
jgi:hypothetical protein